MPGLKIDLVVDKAAAKKSVDDFVRQAKKTLSELKINPGGVGRGGKQGGGFKQMSDEIKSAEKNVESFGKTFGRVLETENQKSIKAAKAGLASYDKALDQFWKDHEKNQKAWTKSVVEGSKKQEKATQDQVQKSRNMVKESQAEKQRAIEAERSQRREMDAELSRRQQQRRVEMQRTSVAEREMRQATIQANLQADQRAFDIYKVQQQRRLKMIREQELAAVRARRVGGVGGIGGTAAEAARAQAALGKSTSRMTQHFFMAQQAIEDYSFAGVRGATNNLAQMASMMGGPGGIIALIGITALTLPHLTERLGLFGESAESATDRLKRHAEAHIALQKALRSGEKAGFDVFTAGADPKKKVPSFLPEKVKEFKKQEDLLESKKSELMFDTAGTNQKRLQQSILQNIINIETKRQRLRVGGPSESPEMAERRGRAFKETGEELKRQLQQLSDAGGVRLQMNNNLNDAAKQHQKTLKETIQEEAQSNAETANKIKGMERSLDLHRQEVGMLEKKAMENHKAEAVGKEALKNELEARERLILEGADDIKQITKATELKKEQARIEEEIQDVRRKISEIKLQEKDVEGNEFTLQQMKEQAEGLKRQQNEQAKILQAKAKELEVNQQAQKDLKDNEQLQKSILRSIDQQVSASEKHIEQINRKIESEKEYIEKLRQGKFEQENQFESGKLGAQGQFGSRFISAQAQQMKNQVKMMRAMGGISGPASKMFESQIDQRAQAAQENLQRQLMAKQMKFLALRAQQAGGVGDTETQRKLLEQLQQAQLQAAGQAMSPQEFQYFMGLAQQTQENISQTFHEQKAAAEENISNLEAAKTSASALLVALTSSKVELEGWGPAMENFRKELNIVEQDVSRVAEKLERASKALSTVVTGQKITGNLKIPGFAGGGRVDNIPAMLSEGEVVLNQQQQNRIGAMMGADPSRMFAAAGVPGFAKGGSVKKNRMAQRPPSMSNPRDIAEMLGVPESVVRDMMQRAGSPQGQEIAPGIFGLTNDAVIQWYLQNQNATQNIRGMMARVHMSGEGVRGRGNVLRGRNKGAARQASQSSGERRIARRNLTAKYGKEGLDKILSSTLSMNAFQIAQFVNQNPEFRELIETMALRGFSPGVNPMGLHGGGRVSKFGGGGIASKTPQSTSTSSTRNNFGGVNITVSDPNDALKLEQTVRTLSNRERLRRGR